MPKVESLQAGRPFPWSISDRRWFPLARFGLVSACGFRASHFSLRPYAVNVTGFERKYSLISTNGFCARSHFASLVISAIVV